MIETMLLGVIETGNKIRLADHTLAGWTGYKVDADTLAALISVRSHLPQSSMSIGFIEVADGHIAINRTRRMAL